MFFGSGGSLSVADTQLVGNVGGKFGGALALSGSTSALHLDGCVLRNNVAASSGSHLYFRSSADMLVERSTFQFGVAGNQVCVISWLLLRTPPRGVSQAHSLTQGGTGDGSHA
jgi:hypothetical protein